MADVQITLRIKIYMYILLSSITTIASQAQIERIHLKVMWTIHYRSVTSVIAGQTMSTKKEKSKKEI
jgi:hypothetical protein